MIIHQFPDLQWLKDASENGFRKEGAETITGWPTKILNVKSQSDVIRPDIKGPLTLFLNISGGSYATVGNHRARVETDTFFLSNNGERYTLEIDKSEKTETFNIHLGGHFLEKVIYQFENKEDHILENPNKNVLPTYFYNQLYKRTSAFDLIILELLQANKSQMNTPLFFEQSLFEIVKLILKEDRYLKNCVENVPSIKVVTKEEIARRILVAKDYIHSFYMQRLTLDELAEISNMSKFHFLRHFKSFIGLSPHQYVNKVRVEKASQILIHQSDINIYQVANFVGFPDTSSFSRTFYKYIGCYPTQFLSYYK